MHPKRTRFTSFAKGLSPSKGLVFQFVLCMLLLGLAVYISLPVSAQNGPTIFLSQTTGSSGQQIQIDGSGFTPGGYVGSILIDGTVVDTFDIPGTIIGGPVGGFFSLPFYIPLDLAEGEHLIEICSLNPCATGEFEQRSGARFTVETAAPEISGRIAYIYDSDARSPDIYNSLFEQIGYDFEGIQIADVLTTDFTQFDLIIVGYDTGVGGQNSWGTVGTQAQHIASAEKPILGMGTGGALFFNGIQRSISLNNADPEGRFQGGLVTNDFEPASFYEKPYNVINVQRNPLLTLYDGNGVETILLQPIDDQTPFPIGYAGTPLAFPTVAAEDCRVLWGYNGAATRLTDDGRSFLVNVVYNTMGLSCESSPAQVCTPMGSPEAFPDSRALINFDTLGDKTIDPGNVLSTLYQADFGVTFVESELNQVIASNDVLAPRSPANVALNNSLDIGIGSDDVPLIIDFDEAKSHVGFYIGANQTLDADATLTAFNSTGAPICFVSRNFVPAGHTEFLGVQDPASSIVRVTLDYGGEFEPESIDDLIFSPYTPPEPPLADCTEVESTQEIRESDTIFFDFLNDKPDGVPIATGTVLTDLYAESHGVTFVENAASQVKTEVDVPLPPSNPNVALNALPPDSPLNVTGPLTIDFDEDKSYVGFFYGAFSTLETAAVTLTAFDREGAPFCQVRRRSVSNNPFTFMGIQDDGERIARVSLEYDAPAGEMIDNLSFAPAAEVKEEPREPRQKIHICVEDEGECIPAPKALLHLIVGGFELTPTLPISPTGDVVNPALVQPGDELWARVPISPTGPLSTTGSFDFYYTSGLTPTIVPPDFGPTSTMTVTVNAENPLLVSNIDMSTQWNLEGDPVYKAKLEANLHKASNYLYDFTNAQFALGEITVNQNYDMWHESAIWLHADNNQRPLALIGGMVDEITPDIDASLNISYASGHIYMGSEWNRYYEPPGDPDITSTVNISDDWSLALGHEISHFSLFQWDSYFGIFDTEDPNVKEVKSVTECTGSAMGFVYFEENTEFIHDQGHWNTNCDKTHAFQQVGERTEWATIQAWYPWVITPTADNAGPAQPPVELTNVNFVPPENNNPTLINQTFDLLYEPILVTRSDAEVIEPGASDRARAYLIRDNRIIEQGQPAEGTRKMELTGAAEGDRFCLFDVKNLTSQQTTLIGTEDEFDPKTASRHQFGCKILAAEAGAGDIEEYELDLERDVLWEPVIYVNYVTSKTINISLTLPISVTDISLKARVYPEHKAEYVESDVMVQTGDTVSTNAFSTTVVMTDFTPSAYVQIWATEDAATETDPRREAIIGSGTKGAVVPGPARFGGHAPIISPKGDFIILFNESINLGRGQFVAIQETFALPALPANTTAVTDISSYRLTGFPQTLITDGVVSLRYLPPVTLPLNNQVSAANADAEMSDLTVYFWNGNEWEPLSTNVEVEPDGSFLASAPIGGAGTYALLRQIEEPPPLSQPTLYLPVIQ